MTAINSRISAQWVTSLTAVPNLRNGEPAAITSMAYKATVPVVYHWVKITGLTHANAMANVDVAVRATQMQLGAELNSRSKAIVLGVTRMVTVAAWRLDETELNASETVAATATIGNNEVTWTAGAAAAGNATAELSVEEKAVVPFLMHIAAPVLALQGLSLVETDHHFIQPTAHYFTKHLQHVLKSAPAAVSNFVNALGADFNDMMFHKACHPVAVATKTTIARANATATALRLANCPTAAIRFPAVPGDVKAARAALAVMTRSTTTILAMQGTISTERLTVALNNVAAAADDAARKQMMDALGLLLEGLKPQVAYCAGIVKQEQETAGILNSTLMNSHFVKKVLEEYASHVGEGGAIARALKDKLKKGLEAGTMTARIIT